jgi:hypothetical protein
MMLRLICQRRVEPPLSVAPENGATHGNNQFYRAITIMFFAMLFFCTPWLQANEEGVSTWGRLFAESRTAEEIINEFMQDSLKFRLEYDFAGGFSDEKTRETLLDISRKAGKELGRLYEISKERQAEIEAYEGDDWDKLYGVTGMWHRTAQEAERSIWYKSHVDYFLAIASGRDEREKILVEIIKRCQAREGLFGTAAGEHLKAKASAAMGGSAHLQRARKIIDSILAREGLSEDVYFQGSIFQLKLDKSISRVRVFELVEALRQSKKKDDFELNVRLAFLGLRVGWPELLAEVVKRWPSAEGFVGSILLKQMAVEPSEGLPGDKSVLEVELAVKAALLQEVSKYRQMFLSLCEKAEYRTALILYGAAAACAESEPVKAVAYYIQSAEARQNEKDCKLELDAVEIMHEGTELACKLYYKDAKYIDICEEALKEYFEAAGKRRDEGLQYFYAGVLEGRGRRDEASKLLGDIAKGGGRYSLNARLDLIMRELRSRSVNEGEKEKIKRQLKELIELAEVGGEQGKVVKGEAVRLYCQLLLESGSEKSAREVLSMLGGAALDKGVEEVVLKARALGILGRWDEGVSILANQIEPNDCDMAVEAFSVLSEVVERLEEYSERASERGVFVDECAAIADYCIRCLDGPVKGDAELLLAELALLSQPDKKTVGKIKVILAGQERPNNIAVMRCRARLLAVKGDFAEAGKIWGQICTARQGIERSEKRDWRWWRARFNQLHCFSRQQGINKEEIIRSVEVLERSFEDIPVFWARKLKKLKEGLQK